MKKNQAKKPAAQRLIVGMSGASGVAYGIRLLEALKELGIESHLVMSKPAELTIAYETKLSVKQVAAKADHRYAISDVGAAIASGSFRTGGMVIAPCSVRTFSEIATGVTTSLLTRAADVCLKDWRKWAPSSCRPCPPFMPNPARFPTWWTRWWERRLIFWAMTGPIHAAGAKTCPERNAVE